MNYEKKYKKLVEAIKVLQETNPSDEGIQNWVNDNVPELKESEDEKIRKSIIAILNNYVDNSNTFKPKMIAWLEKQEPKQKWVDRTCKWLFDNFRISSFDSQKIVTDFTNMYDLRDSFIKATEE